MHKKSLPSPMWPEVFRSDKASTKAVSRAVDAGELRPLGLSLYTSNLTDPPEAIIARHRWRILGLLSPGATVSYRTALTMRPEVDGTVFLTGAARYERDLPGLRIRVVKGPAPLEHDTRFAPGLALASRERALLEALKPTKARGGVRRGVDAGEAERVLEQAFQTGGESAVNRFRDRARDIAPLLDADREFTMIHRAAAVILGSRPGTTSVPTAAARLAGTPYDPDRERLFESLFQALREFAPPELPDAGASAPSAFTNVAFFDAYFSNFIEGTEFEVDEAHGIVFDGRIPAARPADAHDVLGTHAIVGSRRWMDRPLAALPSNEAYEDHLRAMHAVIMEARPEKRPGEFKEVANRAGDTSFVAPDLVRGTLRRGLDFARALTEPLQRAIAVMFVLSEVHPFDDGNGRVARAAMNAELVSAKSTRIIIPSVFRDEYLSGLRNLSRQGYAATLIEVLAHAQQWTAAVSWADYAAAEQTLRACHAFERPRPDIRLHMPRALRPARG